MPDSQISPQDLSGQHSFPKKLWHRFNRWRKRWFWVRLLFLLLFAAHIVNEAFFPLLPKLTSMAIESIDAGSEPTLVNALSRHRRIRFAWQLQTALRAAVDRNGDDVLDEPGRTQLEEWGLDAAELEKKSIHADLTQLIHASHRAGLLPMSFTARDVRRDARFAAVVEVEQMKRAYRDEINAMLKASEMPDYGHWTTWKRGATRLYEQLLMFVYMLGKPQTLLVWFSACFFVPLILTAHLPKGKYAIGLLLGTAFGAAVVYSSCFRFIMRRLSEMVVAGDVSYVLSHLLPAVALLTLSTAFAGSAGRVASGRHRPRIYSSVGLLGLGAVLLFWSLPRWASGEVFQTTSGEGHWVFALIMGSERLLFDTVPDWVRDGAMVPGAILLIVGAWGTLLPLWKKKAAKGEGA